MSEAKLFTAIYIPETPFVNGALKPNKAKKYLFDLLSSEKITDTLFHFIYKKDVKQIHSYYYIGDEDDVLERYLFVEINDFYDEFVSQFWGDGQRYGEVNMDIYLDVNSPEKIVEHIDRVYKSHFYEIDEPTPLCHFFGQQMWHDNAYLVANRTALNELKEAIDIALKHGESRLGLSPSDGEGYDLYIKCVGDDFEWEELEMPYHDRECYVPDETTGIPPHRVFKNYKQFLGE